MENLTIDRGQWLTGAAAKHTGFGTLLQARTGLMCCLGFYGKACGVLDQDMVGMTVVTALPQVPQEAAWLRTHVDAKDRNRFQKHAVSPSDKVESILASINDQKKGIHPARRESAIAYLFKKYGSINVTFVGKYADATRKARAAATR